MSADYKAMRKAARLPESTVPICFRGDLIADFEVLERELEQAQAGASSDSLDSGMGELRDRMEAIQAEMRENTYPVRLRGMSYADYNALIAKHPARYDDEGRIAPDDATLRINSDTFFEPLIRASIVDPELPTVADWEEFLSGLTDYQFNQLGVTALALNRGGIDVPFSLAASSMKRTSGGE